MTLAEFIAARLDEDQAAAEAAPGENWHAFGMESVAGASVYDDQWRLLDPVDYDHNDPFSGKPGATGPEYIHQSQDVLCEHVARHDPARVLREVAAKRAILTRWQAVVNDCQGIGDPKRRPRKYGEHDGLYLALSHLAAVWSDHPDYRTEWKP